MFHNFFTELRQAAVPVTLKEYLVLIEGLDKSLADFSVEDFYYLSRTTLVKDERNLDKFDRVFGHVFKGVETTGEAINAEIPEDWLKLLTEKYFTEEEKKQIDSLGGWDKLMETLKRRLEEKEKRHQASRFYLSRQKPHWAGHTTEGRDLKTPYRYYDLPKVFAWHHYRSPGVS